MPIRQISAQGQDILRLFGLVFPDLEKNVGQAHPGSHQTSPLAKTVNKTRRNKVGHVFTYYMRGPGKHCIRDRLPTGSR